MPAKFVKVGCEEIMKNFLVNSVLGKVAGKSDADADATRRSGHNNKSQPVQRERSVTRNGRRTEGGGSRLRGKSCDRLTYGDERRLLLNKNNAGNDWSQDDGGFAQWRAIHQQTATVRATRPDASYHHARPVSIADRIHTVLSQPDRNQQNRFIQSYQAAYFDQTPPASLPYFHPSGGEELRHGQMYPRTENTADSWTSYQNSTSSEETFGPQSLDFSRLSSSQHRQLQQQQQNTAMASALSRKLSAYGTLPRSRQRFYTAKYQHST